MVVSSDIYVSRFTDDNLTVHHEDAAPERAFSVRMGGPVVRVEGDHV